jgi:hypothetical protein
MVIAHELGHNFGTPHSHDFCPPLDECAPSGWFGQCQTQQTCTSQGSIMSYCHLCNGGTANVTTYFHPTTVQVMRDRALACLPDFTGISVQRIELFDPSAPTPLEIRVAGSPVGPVELHYRFGSGPFHSLEAVPLTVGVYTAEIPPGPCGQLVHYYATFVDAICGPGAAPADGADGAYFAPVGVHELLYSDDFETDQGWFATNLGATAGDWERGVPVNDPGWAYDPESDYDGSGQCWLTENRLGNSDVDNGAVRLTSPAFDLGSTKPTISYAYFLRLTNSNGADKLLVEISVNGLDGPWVEIARHTTNGGTAWRTHQVSNPELVALGVIVSANTRLRFTANDDNPQSVVEAALDAFSISHLACQPGPLGTSYCQATPNSTGAPALLGASGSASIASNDFTLLCGPVPNQPGIYFHGPQAVELPFGDGFRCVGGQVVRLDPPVPGVGNQSARAVDLAAQGFTPGQTVRFQLWYRDPAMGLSGFNLSDGLSVSFWP